MSENTADQIEENPLEAGVLQPPEAEGEQREATPLEATPVEATPVEATLVEITHVKAAPVEVTPLVEITHVKAAPSKLPVEATSVEATPVEATAVEATPVEATPVETTDTTNGDSEEFQAIEPVEQGPEASAAAPGPSFISSPNAATKRIVFDPTLDDEEEIEKLLAGEYVVEEIIGRKITNEGDIFYLVRWLGWDTLSWVAKESCNSPDLIIKFETKMIIKQATEYTKNHSSLYIDNPEAKLYMIIDRLNREEAETEEYVVVYENGTVELPCLTVNTRYREESLKFMKICITANMKKITEDEQPLVVKSPSEVKKSRAGKVGEDVKPPEVKKLKTEAPKAKEPDRMADDRSPNRAE
ncbi:hypothetical protein L596_021343 [Steinernema carpocapsae]|uniref:Chromo domain-containing protein n=1 Tax=Steinernema carpocapsae TaxID=34508 RepID=A0A4U5MIH2_STECR|nr:hypothetical protein L596_021343 [Steinernema carpocapsae]